MSATSHDAPRCTGASDAGRSCRTGARLRVQVRIHFSSVLCPMQRDIPSRVYEHLKAAGSVSLGPNQPMLAGCLGALMPQAPQGQNGGAAEPQIAGLRGLPIRAIKKVLGQRRGVLSRAGILVS